MEKVGGICYNQHIEDVKIFSFKRESLVFVHFRIDFSAFSKRKEEKHDERNEKTSTYHEKI